MGACGGKLPNKVSGLTVWLDASDMSMINSGGTISDGVAISTWVNKTGLGNLTSSGTKMPLYKLNIQNGLNAVLFDGVNDRMLSGVITALQTPRITMFAVYKLTTASPSTTNIVMSSNYAAVDNMYNFSVLNTPAFNALFRNSSNTGTNMTIVGNPTNCVAVCAVNKAIGLSTHKVNSITPSSEVSITSDFNSASHQAIVLGCRAIGASEDLFLSGYIMELIIYATELSTGDQIDILYYLNKKWGL